MIDSALGDAHEWLSDGIARSFGQPIDSDIPGFAAGCYTIWNDTGQFICAGMAGRTMTPAQIQTARDN